MRKRCKICGCYLDPGEWCRCDEEGHEEPEREEARRPIAKRTPPLPVSGTAKRTSARSGWSTA